MRFLLCYTFWVVAFSVGAQDASCNCIKYELFEMNNEYVLENVQAPAIIRRLDTNGVELFFEVGGGYEAGQSHYFNFQNQVLFNLDKNQPVNQYNAKGTIFRTRTIPQSEIPLGNLKVKVDQYDPKTNRIIGKVLAYLSLGELVFRYSGEFDVLLEVNN